LLEVGKENLKTNVGGEHVGLSIVDKGTHNTRDTIANDLGWSTGKVAMADKVWKDATPEIKEQVLSGDVSINQAYKDIKKVEARATG
jgi:2-polyprenyl-3-methyl-5-hydroxy-6-metoxy-1,4-benzoquinol methylase